MSAKCSCSHNNNPALMIRYASVKAQLIIKKNALIDATYIGQEVFYPIMR